VQEIFDRLAKPRTSLEEQTADARVTDVRAGLHWTAVVLERPDGRLSAGLAATLTPEGWEHGRPFVREAGRLIGRPALDVAALIRSDSPTERSIGLAALNAQIGAERALAASEGNAEDLLFQLGAGKRVAVVGHFPFVDRLRLIADQCWVLELQPGPTDEPAERAPELIPQADVVVITAMTLLNGTFGALVRLSHPGAFVMLLGPSAPLSPTFFDYGIDAISGAVVYDIPAVLAAVSQGANFRQMPGRRLLTLVRPAPVR
jgi:hypothetical protein